MTDEWWPHAEALADAVTHPGSRWFEPLARVPRHVFVPAWWRRADGGWQWTHGPLAHVYADRSLVTRVGPLHADHAGPGDTAIGLPTSSSTEPGLLVKMYRYAHLADGLDVLDVGTGSGYGAALLAHRYGDQAVTSVDVDPYLTKAAAGRLDEAGLHPAVVTVDATGPLPGSYDRIVSTVAVRPVPPSWLAALRLGGRLVTVIAGTWLILTATKTPDGVFGQVERDWAGFMRTRTGEDYPAERTSLVEAIGERAGEQVAMGRYPLVDVAEAWELRTMLEIASPGIQHRFERGSLDGSSTAWMAHPDGSWARARTLIGQPLPVVHQGGVRRLWDELDAARESWLREGAAPFLGARAMVEPDGTVKLARGSWRGVLA
ncbi:MAG: methyltransferase domain-containing protein [Sciscionella sp.]